MRGAWILAGLCLWPVTGFAGNGVNPRTPVVWEDAPCMQRVDRSVDPLLHLPYGIPREDTAVTSDEVPDSRTHQFFALCRRRHPQDPLPNWITWADVDAAVVSGLLESRDEIAPRDVLESSMAWQGCWHRITEDDERRPIAFEVADEGVDWDTSALPIGAYTIFGFTHEPLFNLWIGRPGVVIVHDGDPTAVGPAGAIENEEAIVYQGDTVPIEGCIDALDGTTVTAFYASTHGGSDSAWEPDWVPFAQRVPIDGDRFSVDFVAPEALAGRSSMIRADFEDPEGRTHTTYMQSVIIVLAGTDPDACSEDTGFLDNPGCDPDDTTGSSAEGDTTEGTDDPPPSSSGRCSASPTRPNAALALWVLASPCLRRRGRERH